MRCPPATGQQDRGTRAAARSLRTRRACAGREQGAGGRSVPSDALRWVLIGHLQTNKARYAARFADEFQALDSLRVAEALDTQLQKQGRALDVLVQVNTSGEASKFGLAPADVAAFVRQLPAFSSLRVRGLMTLAVFSPDAALVRRCFVRLRTLRDQLRQDAPDGITLDELSMGMSGDFELAIAEGATTVRVGSALFGARSPAASPDPAPATGAPRG
jgi:pyridoxal phosphate enzyme (YggS family)